MLADTPGVRRGAGSPGTVPSTPPGTGEASAPGVGAVLPDGSALAEGLAPSLTDTDGLGAGVDDVLVLEHAATSRTAQAVAAAVPNLLIFNRPQFTEFR